MITPIENKLNMGVHNLDFLCQVAPKKNIPHRKYINIAWFCLGVVG